jgi:hypothetical protein
MTREKLVIRDGVEQWLHLINKYNMSPKEALDTMQKHGQDVASVLIYLESILDSFTLNIKDK